MSGFREISLIPVEPGYQVAGPSGEVLIVRDGKAVSMGGAIYLTHSDYAGLSARLDAQAARS